MNIKSRLIAFSTVAALTLSMSVQGFATTIPFGDIENISFKDKITALQDKGYINGISEGIFAPDKSMTSAEFIQLIVNSFGLNIDNIRFIKEPKATDYFVNADDNAWYKDALIIAAVNGVEIDSNIDLNKELTREEFTYYLVQAMEKFGNLPMIKIIPQEFSDKDQSNIDYDGAIQRAIVYGVAKLNEEGKFNPKEKMTRAQAAEQVYDALEYLKNHQPPVEAPESSEEI